VRLPIRARMTAGYVAVLAVIIAAVGAFLVLRLRTDLTSAIDHTLAPAAHQIALGYDLEGAPDARDVSSTVLSGEPAASQVLDPAGRVMFAYGDPVARASMLGPGDRASALARGRVKRTSRLGPGARRFRLAAEATTTRGGRRVIVVAAESLAASDRSVHRVLVLLLLAGPAALVLTALAGWWLARRALRPIDRLTTEAQAIGADRLRDRLAVPGTGDEVADLAATLNTMLARIQHGVEEQQRLVADTSHELRSPLAAMRAELDVSLRADDLGPAAREVLASAREEVDRMSRTVDGLLVLASADEDGLTVHAEIIDLADVAAAVVATMGPLARSRSVVLELDAGGAATVADATAVQRAVGNIVDNAIKYSPDGAAVRVSTTTSGGEAVVEVADRGPGVAPDLGERVFDRFFRLDAARTPGRGGSGIGLAIVREVARAHGGRAWVRPAPGGGSVFSLALPAATAGGEPAATDEHTDVPVAP
jgi:two-component system OmpR family sensor kinase